MSLINEINHQAAEQGKTIVTDQPVEEAVSDLVNLADMAPDDTYNEETLKRVVKDYKSKVPGDIDLKDKPAENKESDFDGEKAGETSSED